MTFLPEQQPFAVIFDVDGVLVDSYDAHLASWQALAAETGVQFTREQFAETFGRTSREIIRQFWPPQYHGEQAVNCLDQRKESLYREMVASEFPVMDGAVELIQSLKAAEFKIALGSSGPKENINMAISRLAIGRWIQTVVSGEDVQRGKPDPEVFVLAAQRINVSNRRCLVIEDAPAGIAAATSAGMASIAMLSKGRHRADFVYHQPRLFVESLRELSAALIRQIVEQAGH